MDNVIITRWPMRYFHWVSVGRLGGEWSSDVVVLIVYYCATTAAGLACPPVTVLS
ncbi:hypothetical protein BJV74DRAFT_30864 [Russula compacta]|nr:hypothetical protein BJV74DRAFT_30864 [Russula compacta]